MFISFSFFSLESFSRLPICDSIISHKRSISSAKRLTELVCPKFVYFYSLGAWHILCKDNDCYGADCSAECKPYARTRSPFAAATATAACTKVKLIDWYSNLVTKLDGFTQRLNAAKNLL